MLNGMKVGIVGGSIAGCAVAVRLMELGADITVFEKSQHQHAGRGAGIVLPETFLKQCIALNLFDKDIPHLEIASRSFLIKDQHLGRVIWHQPSFPVVALNWQHIYQNLRRKVPNKNYCSEEVISVSHQENSCFLETKSNKHLFDLVIAADGIDSNLRRQFFPKAIPQYVNYVAWRGVVKKIHPIFEQHVPYFAYSNGHILLYRIPDVRQSGEVLLNWVMYEDRSHQPLETLLTDKNGKRHTVSLPPGSLSDKHIEYLQTFAKRVLPPGITEIICETEEPFLQAVYDLQIPSYVQNRICFVGDAATILRPHTASGVLKALKDAISLSEACSSHYSRSSSRHPRISSHHPRESGDLPLLESLNQWNQSQQNALKQEVALARSMGEALVTHTPDWTQMDQEQMDEWWKAVMSGKKWYATEGVT